MLFLIWNAYHLGGDTMNSYTFRRGPAKFYKYWVDWIEHRPPASMAAWTLGGLGAMIYFVLAGMRFRFIWWPLHPIGFCVGGTFVMKSAWFTCLCAWLIKGAILRYGGLNTYHRLRPAFLGLICGTFTCLAVWIAIDLLTGHAYNRIFYSSVY